MCNKRQGREKKPAYVSGFCNVVQTMETSSCSLVMRLGQRFESARRLSQSSLSKLNTRNLQSPRFVVEGFLTPLSKHGYRVSRLLITTSGTHAPDISSLASCSAETPPPPPRRRCRCPSPRGVSHNVLAWHPTAPANDAGFCPTRSSVRFDLYGGSGQKPSPLTMP